MSEDVQKKKNEENAETMETKLVRSLRDQGFWKEMWHQVRLAWILLRSPDVPFYLKLLPVIAVIYVLVPTDLIPDVFPVIGQLDDLTALIVGAKIFIELSPQDVVNRHILTLRRPNEDEGLADSMNNVSDSLNESIIIEGEYNHLKEQKNNRDD